MSNIENKNEEQKIYPHSAPNYMEDYIKNESQKVKLGYEMIGSSPKTSGSLGIYNYLNKSVGTFKNFIGN